MHVACSRSLQTHVGQIACHSDFNLQLDAALPLTLCEVPTQSFHPMVVL